MYPKFKPQFRRLLAIHRELKRGKKVNCRTLLGLPEFEDLRRKTVLRDIEYMRERGAPIDYDGRRKTYFYTEETFDLAALQLTEGEVFAVAVAEKILEQYRNTPLHATLSGIFEKIRQQLPGKVLVAASALDPRFTFLGTGAVRIAPGVWEGIADGLSRMRTLEIVHTSAGRETPVRREVDPYHVVIHGGAWYLLGHCHAKGEIRTFNFSRISEVKVLAETFALPRGFDLAKTMGPRFGIIFGGPERRVRVRFAPKLAPYVVERDWHPTQEIARRRDGSVELALRVNDLIEIRRWLLSWGEGVEVLSPKALRDGVRDEAKALARANR